MRYICSFDVTKLLEIIYSIVTGLPANLSPGNFGFFLREHVGVHGSIKICSCNILMMETRRILVEIRWKSFVCWKVELEDLLTCVCLGSQHGLGLQELLVTTLIRSSWVSVLYSHTNCQAKGPILKLSTVIFFFQYMKSCTIVRIIVPH